MRLVGGEGLLELDELEEELDELEEGEKYCLSWMS